MDLITLDEAEEALGQTLDNAQQELVLRFIRLVSTYITSYTGVSFGQVVTASIRAKADYYGVVELPGGPVQEVTSVHYFYGGEPGCWEWDGLDEIYGLSPNAVVDITYKHGYAQIPDDIREVATEVVKRVFLSPDGQGGALFKYRVGDVEEMYSGTFGGMGRGMFNDLEKLILDQYRVTAKTYRTGFHLPDPPSIPSSDTALYE